MREGWSRAAAAADVATAAVAKAEACWSVGQVARTTMEGEARRETVKVEGVMAVVAKVAAAMVTLKAVKAVAAPAVAAPAEAAPAVAAPEMAASAAVWTVAVEAAVARRLGGQAAAMAVRGRVLARVLLLETTELVEVASTVAICAVAVRVVAGLGQVSKASVEVG